MSGSPSGGGCSCGPKAPPQFTGSAGGGGLGGGGPLTPAFDCQCVCFCVPLQTPTGDEPPPTTLDGSPSGGSTLRRFGAGAGSAMAVLSVGRPSTGTVLPLRGLSASAFPLLGPPQAALGGVRPLGLGLFAPAWTLGGGRQGTGVRPLARAPASGVASTRRRNAVPSPCTPTLENYSPSLKGARYPTSMGDGLQRSFAGCDTGKFAPGGAPPLTVSLPTATPDASRGTDWVFLGFGRAVGTRSAPPLSALPDPVHPPQGRYGRSPHGSLDGPPPVAPPHSGVKAFDFGPGGGLGSEGLDRHHDGVPDAVALEIRDRLGTYPGLLPGESPDPDLRTRQPAGALDALDLLGAGVRTPAPRPVLSPALGRGAPGALALDTGPAIAVRESAISRGTPQKSLGGGGGGGVVRGGKAAGLAEMGAALLSEYEQASRQFRQTGDTAWVSVALQAHTAYEGWAEVYRRLQRERNIGLSFEDAVARARKRADKDSAIRERAASLAQRATDRRRSAREKRFDAVSRDGSWREEMYSRARGELDLARGEMRNKIRDARNALLDLRGKEDKEATRRRIAALDAAVSRARVGGDPFEIKWAEDERVRLGEFENLVRSAEEAVAQAEEARRTYENAADGLRKDTLLGLDDEESMKALKEADEALARAMERLAELMVLIELATRPTRPPDPPEKTKGGGTKRRGRRLPWWACSGPNAVKADCEGRKWCPKCGPHEVCVACWWEMVPSEGAGGGKGKVLGREGASFGSDERKVDPSLLQANVDTAPKANYHRREAEGVRSPPDGAAAGVGPQAMGPYGGAPIPYYASPQASPADGAVAPPLAAVGPRDSAASAIGPGTGPFGPGLSPDSMVPFPSLGLPPEFHADPKPKPRRVIGGVDYSAYGDPDAFMSPEDFARRAERRKAEEIRGREFLELLRVTDPRRTFTDRALDSAMRFYFETGLQGGMWWRIALGRTLTTPMEGENRSALARVTHLLITGAEAAAEEAEGALSRSLAAGWGAEGQAMVEGAKDRVAATAGGVAQSAEAGVAPAVEVGAEVNRELGRRMALLGAGLRNPELREFGLDLERRGEEQSEAVRRALETVIPGVSQGRFGVYEELSQSMLTGSAGGLDVGRALREGDQFDLVLALAGRGIQTGILSVDATSMAQVIATRIATRVAAIRAAMPGGGTGGAGRSGVVAESSLAGIGDEVQTGAKRGAPDTPPKVPGSEEGAVGPADSRTTPSDGPPPKEEPKTPPEPVKPEEQVSGAEEKCECKTGDDSTEAGGDAESAVQRPEDGKGLPDIKPGEWRPGGHHSPTQWSNKMADREWTPKMIDEAIEARNTFAAPNNVNPGSAATRFVHPESGLSVVIDNATKEVLYLEKKGHLNPWSK